MGRLRDGHILGANETFLAFCDYEGMYQFES
jgi:hypothetical protein